MTVLINYASFSRGILGLPQSLVLLEGIDLLVYVQCLLGSIKPIITRQSQFYYKRAGSLKPISTWQI